MSAKEPPNQALQRLAVSLHMRNSKPILGLLKRELDHAARILDQAARDVRDLELEQGRNLRKIGGALAARV